MENGNENNQINLDMLMQQVQQSTPAGTPLLLHSCCGPCSSAVLERLAQHFEVQIYFYNPNIWPAAEYEKRLGAQQQLISKMCPAVKLVEGEYEPELFDEKIKGLENEGEGGAKSVSGRCAACFELRLEKSAQYAAKQGIDYFGSTLSLSPHKNAQLIYAKGVQAAQKHGVEFLPADFKKHDGYKRSVALSNEYGIYRQEYCGCKYSLEEKNNNK